MATKEKIYGHAYDKKGFFWAVMYRPNFRCKPHITCLYPRETEARQDVFHTNRRWKEQGFGDNKWSVKRFFFYFRGSEIDAYEHEWFRAEKKL